MLCPMLYSFELYVQILKEIQYTKSKGGVSIQAGGTRLNGGGKGQGSIGGGDPEV